MFTGTIRKIAAVAIVGACALGAGACDSSYSQALWLDGTCQEFRFEMDDPDINGANREMVLKGVFDLESGKEYPLQLGSQTTGVEGSLYSGFFATYGSLSSGTDVTVTFAQGNRRWPIAIPRNKIVFEVVNRPEDTSFALDLSQLDRYNSNGIYLYKGSVVSECSTSGNYPVPDLSKLTLGQVLMQNDQSTIAGATIKLTAEQYAQLVGTIEPTAPATAKTPTE